MNWRNHFSVKRAVMLVILFSVWGYLGCISHVFLFPMDLEPGVHPPKGTYEELEFKSKTGRMLSGWRIFAKSGRPSVRVVLCHGNAGNISYCGSHVKALVKNGCEVVLFDYAGFGNSAGSADVDSLGPDSLAAFDLATDMKPKLPVALYGISLGSSCALHVAARRKPVAVILQGALVPHDEIWRKFPVPLWPIAWVYWLQIPDEMDSDENIKKAGKVPILFIHGRRDPVCDVENSVKLSSEAQGPVKLFLIEGADHYPLEDELFYPRCERVIGDFIRGVTVRRR